MSDHREPVEKIPVGISSCLLGETVRYDGGHKLDRYITDILGRHFEYVPFCPEIAIGLGTPRPPIRLVGEPDDPRAVGVEDAGKDVTRPLRDYADGVTESCRSLAGYIFKHGSPSCGMERVEIYHETGMPAAHSAGVYAGRLKKNLPLLPMEEEGRLRDSVLRENFIMRVYVYHRWQMLRAEGITASRLVDFHSRHKFLLLAHSESHYRKLGQLVADAGVSDLEALCERYIATLMEGLQKPATRKRHSNVLKHIMGYLERDIDSEDTVELVKLIGAYRQGAIPLVVPLTMLKHHFRRNPDPYIAVKYYLEPHPEEMMLRNDL